MKLSFCSVLVLICLGFAGVLGVNTAEAQISFEVELDPKQETYPEGSSFLVTFYARVGTGLVGPSNELEPEEAQVEIEKSQYLKIDSVEWGVEDVKDVNYVTLNGYLTLRVTYVGLPEEPTPVDAYIRGDWKNIRPTIYARADIKGYRKPPEESALIVVRPPMKAGVAADRVAVGDTFTQDIVICNAQDLSAWQMNVVFNPSILRVVSVTEGAFLETGETVNLQTEAPVPSSALEVDALFLSSAGEGWIPVTDLDEGDFKSRAANQSSEPVLDLPPAEDLSDTAVAEEDLFNTAVAEGKIALSQARIGRLSDPEATPAVGPNPPLLPGVSSTETTAGVLVTLGFEVLEFAEEPLGIHNVQLVDSENERINYSIRVESMIVVTDKYPAEDVNRDGQVNILDLVLVASNIGLVPGNLHNPMAAVNRNGVYAVQYDSHSRVDVNNDGIVNVLDLIMVASHSAWGEGSAAVKVRDANIPSKKAPAAPAAGIAALTPAAIQGWIDLAQVEDDGSAIFDLGIANLQQMLQATVPEETQLLLNYPNPFNPETWIPYQLAKATDVTVSIYSVNGTLVRTLALGHQAAGVYQSKSQAAYWDGRNELGEQVASGVYFYTLTAGDFSATGKMLVRK